ncbi:MAG: ABC transporter ATP-binding protein [Defluviitaleaceae bacterium]|nr:ABC transporter ATP-binding protein [Defluviitaleaceae bacterium]
MLKLIDVCAGYNGIDVVKSLSLEVQKGESLAIVGPNGCGKSTLLKAICGLLSFRGTVEIDGQSTAAMKPRQLAAKVAMLGQISPVYFSYSVYDVVMMGRYLHMGGLLGAPSRMDKDFVEKCLTTVKLWDERDKSINALSGGQLQRVFLARTLAQDPQVILLDEPTNHLDLKFQLELIDYLKNWAKEQSRSVIGVLHDINLAMRLSDNIMLMKAGEIAAMGKIGDVVSVAALEEVYEMDVASAMRETFALWKDLR